MDIAILLGPMHETKPSMTTDLTFVFQSARQQVTNRFEVEQIMIQSNGPYTGYTLKPALLRCPTSVHIHRYPKEWILKGIPSTVHSSESESEEAARWFTRSDRNRWPVQPCVCCYDPFQSQFGGHDQLKRLQREHHVGALRAYQRTEHASLLPWNLSVHIITLSEMCKHHQQEAQDSTAPVFDSSTINPRPGHKLPRRYQRAASSAATTAAVTATTTAEMAASTAVTTASRSPMLPFRDESTNRSRVTGSLSTDNVAQGATQTGSWPRKTDMTSALVGSRKKWFFMQARLLHPVTRTNMEIDGSTRPTNVFLTEHVRQFETTTTVPPLSKARLLHPVTRTNMEIDGSTRPTNVFLTEHVRQFETTTTVPPLSKVNIPHAQTAPNIQSLTSVFRDVTIEPRGHDLTTPPFRSCSLLHLSQPDLVHNQLRGSRVEFVRVPLPDCVVLRLEALIPSDRTRTPRLFASQSVSTSCPLRNTLTGYNHLRLQMHEDQSAMVTCLEPQGTQHQWKHRILRQSVGLLLFCKIHMEVYSPSCFGELMDSVQMEYSSRSNSLNRRTIQPSIPSIPYSSSLLFPANLHTGTFDRTSIMDPFWTTDSASDEPPAHDVF
ncbi:hypothetical protein FGIG_11098 [Fasciola gigantica]|uniref:Uncharacterized protein n=1 Tax=Fasciola gigantica TaxID=46835 RepID=A0A504YQ12_FASGI|nr:hypothetical protein FGIG_11098 [Fasciola gigantica]